MKTHDDNTKSFIYYNTVTNVTIVESVFMCVDAFGAHGAPFRGRRHQLINHWESILARISLWLAALATFVL